MAFVETGHGYEGRAIRLKMKQHRIKIAESEAQEQIKSFFASGEPSAGFYPPKEELSASSNVIFLADVVKKREDDLAKKKSSCNKYVFN